MQAGLRVGDRPLCAISGGEPIVRLVETDLPRLGGRNQELALAAIVAAESADLMGIALLSGGTDGEDGPTDAAGGFADQQVLGTIGQLGLDARAALAINDANTLLGRANGLFRTGPTHTNVMDVRVLLVTPLVGASGG
jgi:hydroxypyruvate reductase